MSRGGDIIAGGPVMPLKLDYQHLPPKAKRWRDWTYTAIGVGVGFFCGLFAAIFTAFILQTLFGVAGGTVGLFVLILIAGCTLAGLVLGIRADRWDGGGDAK